MRSCPVVSVMSRTSMSRLVNARRSPSSGVDGVDCGGRVVDGWRECTQSDVRQEANREHGVLVEGSFGASDDCSFDHVVGYVAAMDVGEWGAFMHGVADSDAERDDGVSHGGGVDEGKKIELLNDPRRDRSRRQFDAAVSAVLRACQ